MALLESPKAMVQEEDAPKGCLDLPNCPYCHRPMGDGYGEETNSLQRDDARFKAIWSKEMGDAGQGSVYRSVSVLLISWDDKAGDLNTEEEVVRLGQILREKYNFNVEDQRLAANKRAQLQLNRHIANFVDENDDEHGLLIVYYAGHGIPGSIAGELTLAGSRDPELYNSERKKKWNEIIWNHAESLLKESAGDVLIIFDCCAAGNLGRDIGVRGRGAHRAFEFLGATSAEYTTPEPGPNSFTSGLIWALEQLAAAEEFTTSELLRKITDYPSFPRDQYPVLCERDKPSLKKICISPLSKDQSHQKERAAKESSAPAECLEFLDLRVLLTRHPTEDDITKIAQNFREMLRRNSIEAVRHIAWGRLSTIQGSTGRFPRLVRMISYTRRWKRKSGKKSPKQDALRAKEDLNGVQTSGEPSDASRDDSEASRKRRRGQ